MCFYETESETRNPVIADVLHDTEFAETKGLGMGVIRREMRKAGLAPPEFDNDHTGNRFTTTLYLHHFLEPERIDWLGQFKHLDLSEAQVRGLVHVREAERIDNPTYREINGVNIMTASNDLGSLRDAGLLEMKGGGTATYYVPTEKLLAAPGDDAQGKLPFDAEPQQADPETPQAKGEESGDEGQTLQDDDQTLQGERQTLQASLPASLQAALQDLGAQVPQEDLRAIITRLCRWRALSAREVASLLDKDAYYVRQEHIGPMVKTGRLKRTIPDAPRHPHQKYRAADSSNE